MIKIKHGENIFHDKQGNICCQGCYMLGLKDGKAEAIEQIINLFKKDSIYTGAVIEFEIKQFMEKK